MKNKSGSGDGELSGRSNPPTPSNADTSEQESEEEDEFDVEAILEERVKKGVTEYLVKWDGFDLMNATWEPAEQFNSEDTLMDWARKKLLITAGRERRFDVKRWERDKKRIEAEFAASKRDLIKENCSINTDFDSYFHPLPGLSSSDSDKPLSHRRETRFSSEVSSLFVRPDTVPPEEPRTVPREVPKHPTSGPSKSPKKTGAPVHAVKAPVTPAVLAIPAKPSPKEPAQQKPAIQTAKKPRSKPTWTLANSISRPQEPATKTPFFGSGQTARPSNKRQGLNSRWARERAPDINQLELMKPSEFPSRENYGYIQPSPSMIDRTTVTIKSAEETLSESSLSAAIITSMGPPGPPNLVQSAASNRTENSSEIQAPDTITPTAPILPTMSRAHGVAPRARLTEGDNPPNLPDSEKRSIAPEENSRRKSPDVYHRRGSPDYGRRRSPSLSRRQRSPDVYRPRRSPSPYRRRPSPDAYNRRQSFPAMRYNRHSTSPERHELSRPPSPTSRRHTISRPGSRGPFPPPVTKPRPSAQTVLTEEEKHQIARMPVGIKKKGFKSNPAGHFWNPGEVLAHAYFGVDKQYIGAVRLCGHKLLAAHDLIASKRKGSITLDVWFKHSCTFDQYQELARDFHETRSHRLWCNAWMEGFEDSNEQLFYMAESLRRQNMAAIHYPANGRGMNWIAYSPSSIFDRFLTNPGQIRLPSGAVICLAVRGPLPDFSTLSTISSNLTNPRAPVIRQLDNTRPGQSTTNDNKIQAPLVGSPNIHPSRLWMLTKSDTSGRRRPDETPNWGPDIIMDTSSDTSFNGQGPVLVDTPQDVREPAMPSQKLGSVRKAPPTNVSEQAIDEMLKIFKDQFKMTLERLGTLDNGDITDTFYLHFPVEDTDACIDLEFMEAWLNHHRVKYWTNRDPRNWEKFHSDCKRGVIIFHESFFQYESLRPKIRSYLWKDNHNFWTVRLRRPLDLPDLRYCSEGSHIQAIFPHSSAILLTEDVVQDLKRAAMIVCWFYHKHISSKTPVTSKLVLCPDFMTKLEKRLDNPNRDKNDDVKCVLNPAHVACFLQTNTLPSIMSIIACIKMVNSTDPNFPFFELDSLSIQSLDRSNNNVLCLPIPGYGTRTGAEHAHTKCLTQPERDADHLVEAFAGWTQVNAARFRKTAVVTFLKNEPLLSRWSGWGHVVVLDGFKAFCRAFATDESILFERLQNGLQRQVNSPQLATEGGVTTPWTPHTPQESRDPRKNRGDPSRDRKGSRDPRLAPEAYPSNPLAQPYR
ncbi:hypothetical protein N7520_008187 [Penicillium odoratum]|uniref:uncharacterized protein n=1 Tax=Penicillium odoratum TaxID=1167516 RepID=UPI0025467894|nr:uncharacterized protein N7520_008187 [Penicillium odoratum]KAJ5761031.1 hypothetical protein N7520_008187 [Penicillium odoratum]